MANSSYWTDSRTARLKKYWAKGHTADAIASHMSTARDPCTKNMVIGKVRRLRLPYRRMLPSSPATFAPEPKERPPQNAPRIRVRKPRPRKGLSIPARAHPLVQALYIEANAQQTSLVDLSKRSGVGLSVFTSWRTVHAPSLPSLEAAFNVLGKTLQPVDKED